MSVSEVAVALGVSRGRAAEYIQTGVLGHRLVPGRQGAAEPRVPAAYVQALAAVRRASRVQYDDLRAQGWHTVAEVAALIGRSPSTITRAIHADRLHVAQFTHEAGMPYLIDPGDLSKLQRRHVPHCIRTAVYVQ